VICSCGNSLIWGGDHDYEDYGIEGDGIVSNLSCADNNCEVDVVYVYKNFNKGSNEEEI